jgi:ABC-type transporter Mla subunit MlaD
METVTVALEQWRISTVQASGAMAQINTTLNAHRVGIEQVNSNLTETGVPIGATTPTLREPTGPLSAATTQMSSSSEALRKAVVETMTRLGELGGVTSQSAADIAKSIEGLVGAWEKQSAHLDKTDEQIEKAFMEVVKNLEQSLGVLQRFSQSLNDSLGSSIRDLGTIAAELVDAVEGIKK